MKKIIFLCIGCLLICACNPGKEAQVLYEEATKIRQDQGCTEAINIYEKIIREYGWTNVKKVAMADYDSCKQEIRKRNIEHNIPIVLKAIDGYKVNSYNRSQSLGKAIQYAKKTLTCQTGKKAASSTFGEYWKYNWEAKTFVERLCSVNIKKWQITSNDNIHYSAIKRWSIVGPMDGQIIHNKESFIINIKNNTIAALDGSACSLLDTTLYSQINKNSGQWDKTSSNYGKEPNWEKECVLPISIEGLKREI